MIRGVYLERTGKSEDCGCSEEEWRMYGAHVTLHAEGDGTGHIIIDYGEWDDEITTETDDLSVMRQEALIYIESLPVE